jgi:hypothetical protein
MRRTIGAVTVAVALSCGVVGVLAGPASAAPGGNSANVKLCLKGGWQRLVRADQTPFVNERDCVSYAAQGGTVTEPSPPGQTGQDVCESYGGTFSTDPASDLNPSGPWTSIVWTCNGVPVTNETVENDLSTACFDVDGGVIFGFTGITEVPANYTCGGSYI